MEQETGRYSISASISPQHQQLSRRELRLGWASRSHSLCVSCEAAVLSAAGKPTQSPTLAGLRLQELCVLQI